MRHLTRPLAALAIAAPLLLALSACGGDDAPEYTSDELYDVWADCNLDVALSGPGTEYSGRNAAVVGCMRDELPGLSFDEAMAAVQKSAERAEFLSH